MTRICRKSGAGLNLRISSTISDLRFEIIAGWALPRNVLTLLF